MRLPGDLRRYGIIANRAEPAFDAQSTSGDGMTPKKTVAAAAIPVIARITGQRAPVGPARAAAMTSASGEPPAIAGSGPTLGAGSGASASPRIQTQTTTRR